MHHVRPVADRVDGCGQQTVGWSVRLRRDHAHDGRKPVGDVEEPFVGLPLHFHVEKLSAHERRHAYATLVKIVLAAAEGRVVAARVLAAAVVGGVDEKGAIGADRVVHLVHDGLDRGVELHEQRREVAPGVVRDLAHLREPLLIEAVVLPVRILEHVHRTVHVLPRHVHEDRLVRVVLGVVLEGLARPPDEDFGGRDVGVALLLAEQLEAPVRLGLDEVIEVR
mmetsp:Transcript_64439/g.178588  ORF Transcript_64439/g.178588 Transcript_64439/m.178588 type:complete len:223 (+) Transcript_64439:733-1401(+)